MIRLIFILFIAASCVFAGQLSDFERAVDSPRSGRSSSHSDDDDEDDDFWGSFFFGCLFGGRSSDESETSYTVITPSESEKAAPQLSVTTPVEDENGNTVGYAEERVDLEEMGDADGFSHRLGSLAMPFIRFDYRWQYLESELDANDYLLEAGYTVVSVIARQTDYTDTASDESLSIDQYYAMLRYGGSDDFFFDGAFQIGLGIGGYIIDGTDRRSGAALTVPVTICLSDYFSVEFRSAWAEINDRTIGDYDISISGGSLYLQGRLGYRWLWVQSDGHWLDGPYAGVSLSF